MKYILGVILIIVGIVIWTNHNKNQCERDALEASVKAYPMSAYPDIKERTKLQESLEKEYLETC